MNDARLTLRFPKELVFKLQKEAKKENRSLSSFIRVEMEKVLKERKKELPK